MPNAVKTPKVKKTATGYEAYVGRIYLGTFGSGAQAQGACTGALALLAQITAEKEAKKLAREHARQNPGSTPAVLEKGIYRRGARFVVASPCYMGYFNTYAEALAARNSAPRTYRTAAASDAVPFEDRQLTLE